jgi:hypothetical protein
VPLIAGSAAVDLGADLCGGLSGAAAVAAGLGRSIGANAEGLSCLGGEDGPFAGDAFERVAAAVGEFDA